MTKDSHPPNGSPRTADRPSTDPDVRLAAEIVETDAGPASCTIYNPCTSGVDRMSRWVTAIGDAFVDCRDWR